MSSFSKSLVSSDRQQFNTRVIMRRTTSSFVRPPRFINRTDDGGGRRPSSGDWSVNQDKSRDRKTNRSFKEIKNFATFDREERVRREAAEDRTNNKKPAWNSSVPRPSQTDPRTRSEHSASRKSRIMTHCAEASPAASPTLTVEKEKMEVADKEAVAWIFQLWKETRRQLMENQMVWPQTVVYYSC